VKVETQVEFGSMLTDMVSQIHHVNNTLPLISANKDTVEENVVQWIYAKTAFHHHALLVRPAKAHAKLLISRNTMSVTTTASQEQQR